MITLTFAQLVLVVSLPYLLKWGGHVVFIMMSGVFVRKVKSGLMEGVKNAQVE